MNWRPHNSLELNEAGMIAVIRPDHGDLVSILVYLLWTINVITGMLSDYNAKTGKKMSEFFKSNTSLPETISWFLPR